MIISRKRLEEMIAGRMEQKERERMLYLRMEDMENNCKKCMEEMRLRIEVLREMLLKNCGKQPPENAEKE